MDALKMCDADTFLQARFLTSDAAEEFYAQVQIWNAVAGLPTIQLCGTAQPSRVVLRSVRSARGGIVRLIEAFGGLAEDLPDR